MARKIILVLTIVLLFAGSAFAVNCHCFNQREFDRADPFSADAYILATAGNSLLSGSTGTEKASIVRSLMGGTVSADLWIAHNAGRASGRDAADFLTRREKEGGWAKAFAAMGVSPEILGKPFAAALPSDEPGAALLLADSVLAASFPGEEKTIASLRAEGATTGEATVALFLKSASGLDPTATLGNVRALKKSWGAYLADANLTPKAFSQKIIALARPSR